MPLPDLTDRVSRLSPADAGEVLTLQLAAWVREAHENATLEIPPLHETVADVARDLADPRYTGWGVREAGRLVAMVRTSPQDDGRTAFVGRLGVVPDRHGEGWGAAVLRWGEDHAPGPVTRFELVTGARSASNHVFYARQGYVPAPEVASPPGTVAFAKDALSRSRRP